MIVNFDGDITPLQIPANEIGIPPTLMVELKTFIKQGKKIEAIKALRTHTYLDLKSAKDVIEYLDHHYKNIDRRLWQATAVYSEYSQVVILTKLGTYNDILAEAQDIAKDYIKATATLKVEPFSG